MSDAGEQVAKQRSQSCERGGGTLSGWLWWPINAVQLLFTLTWSVVGISLALLVRLLTGSEHIPLRMAAWLWAPALIGGAGARVEADGLDRIDFSRPYLLVANHQSMIDICALFVSVPVPLRFMLKASLGKVPFLGWYTRAMHMILLERGKPTMLRRQLGRAVELLEQGHSLAAFPEGTRSSDGRVAPFMAGAFQAAIAAGVPVLPIALVGSGRIMPPGSFRIRPGRIRLLAGQPIQTTGLDRGDHRILAQQAQRAVVELKQKLDSGPGRVSGTGRSVPPDQARLR